MVRGGAGGLLLADRGYREEGNGGVVEVGERGVGEHGDGPGDERGVIFLISYI